MAHPRTQRAFQPRVALGVIYVIAFFFLYCLALVGPALVDVLMTTPPGPEQQAAAREIARETVRPRLGIALVAALVTTVAAARAGVLPGLRRSR